MNQTALLLFIVAAVFYTVGGVFMKLSGGLTRFSSSAAALGLFLLGAVVQTLAMKEAELGVAYVFVLGLEAVLAFAMGAVFFQENVSVTKVLGVALIIGGFALLHIGVPTKAP